MRCTSLAVWLGTAFLVALAGPASASFPQYPPSYWTWGCNNGASCGAKLTAWFNQHGPLFNYGPYYGYPPFEPYGPWNAYLQYNPWYYGLPGGGCHGCHHGDLAGHGPCCGAHWHSSWAMGGWFHGCSRCCHGGLFTGCGWFHGAADCPCAPNGVTGSPCQMGATPKAAFNPETTDPLTRCAGVGNPAEFTAFYAGLPTLDATLVSPGK
jgi:hypothetical protein